MPANGELQPGKGIHVDYNDDTNEWIQKALQDIGIAYVGDDYFDEQTQKTSPERAAQEVQDRLLASGGNVATGRKWDFEKDKFGRKVFTSTPISSSRNTKQELRVTLALTSRDDLKLDIRVWYKP